MGIMVPGWDFGFSSISGGYRVSKLGYIHFVAPFRPYLWNDNRSSRMRGAELSFQSDWERLGI